MYARCGIKPVDCPPDLLISTPPSVVNESYAPDKVFGALQSVQAGVNDPAVVDSMLGEYDEETSHNLMNFLNLDATASDKLFNHMKQPSGATVVQQIETTPLDYSIEDEINDVFQIGAL